MKKKNYSNYDDTCPDCGEVIEQTQYKEELRAAIKEGIVKHKYPEGPLPQFEIVCPHCDASLEIELIIDVGLAIAPF